MYCNNCGTQIPMGGRFCIRCGMSANSADENDRLPTYEQTAPPIYEKQPVKQGMFLHASSGPDGMPYGYKKGKSRRKRLLLIASGCAAAALVLAAILIFAINA